MLHLIMKKLLLILVVCLIGSSLTGCATLVCGLAGAGDAAATVSGQHTNYLQECLDKVNGK
jgi:uncharacterized protein YceK